MARTWSTKAAVEVGVPPGRPPAQVGVDRIANQVVRVQPVRALDDERQRAEPREQAAGVASEEGAQQVLGGDRHVCAGLERLPMAYGRCLVDDLREQRAHHIGQVGQRARRRTPVHSVDQHRQGERMAPADLQQPLAHMVGHPLGGEVGPRRFGRQVGQRDDAHQLAPRRVGTPARTRPVPPGDHDQAVAGQRRQIAFPHPVVDRFQALVRVDEQHRTRLGRDGQWVRPEPQMPGVDPDRRPALLSRHVGERAEQAALADPARPVHEDDARCGQRRPEQRDLGVPSHERLPADPVQLLPERRHGKDRNRRGRWAPDEH
jgi:hypothetical protein